MSAATQIDYGSHAPVDAGGIDYGAHAPAPDRGDQELSKFKAEHPEYKGPVSKLDTSDHSSDPDMQAVLKFKADHPYVYGALHGFYTDSIPLAPIPMDLPGGASLVGRAWDALKATVGDSDVQEKAFKAFVPNGAKILEWKNAVRDAVANAAKAPAEANADLLNQITKSLGGDSFESLNPAQQGVIRGLAARANGGVPAGAPRFGPAVDTGPIDIGEPVKPALSPLPTTRGPLRPPLQVNPPAPDIPAAPAPSSPVTPVRPPMAAAPPASEVSAGPVNTDLSTKLREALRQAKIDSGMDPDLPLGEFRHGTYPARFGGDDSAVIDIAKSKLKFLNSLPESSPLRNNQKALDAAYKMAMELRKSGISIGDLMNQTGK